MDYQKLADFRNTHNLHPQRLGIFVEEIGPGWARATKTVEEQDLNLNHTTHGGIYFTLADTTCGSAMASHGYFAVTMDASYHYFRSAKCGDTLIANAKELKGGKTICVFEVQITDQHQTLLGSGTFTFYRLDKPILLD